MPSFDVVCKLDLQEVDNAINQTLKEVGQRFDFKGTPDRGPARGERDPAALRRRLQGARAGRHPAREARAPAGAAEGAPAEQPIEPGPAGTAKQQLDLQQGIATEKAREIVKLIKDAKLKVQAAIQGEQVRVIGQEARRPAGRHEAAARPRPRHRDAVRQLPRLMRAMVDRRRVHFLTLGCPKNQVDTEVMLGVLARAGHEVVLDPDAADVLVVNTCAFIGPAKEESIDAILDAARVKAAREGRRLVVTGCLAQRYADELRARAARGRRLRRHRRPDAHRRGGRRAPAARAPSSIAAPSTSCPRTASRPASAPGAWWTAYLKVSEGCDHTCSFCIIPKIRGRHESRPIDDVAGRGREPGRPTARSSST